MKFQKKPGLQQYFLKDTWILRTAATVFYNQLLNYVFSKTILSQTVTFSGTLKNILYSIFQKTNLYFCVLSSTFFIVQSPNDIKFHQPYKIQYSILKIEALFWLYHFRYTKYPGDFINFCLLLNNEYLLFSPLQQQCHVPSYIPIE